MREDSFGCGKSRRSRTLPVGKGMFTGIVVAVGTVDRIFFFDGG